MTQRFIEIRTCIHWRKARCTNAYPCQFKRMFADGRQSCTENGVNIDDPRRENSAANRAYDELKKRGHLK